jgi:hypothetical protein
MSATAHNPLEDACTYVVNGALCGQPVHLSHRRQVADGTTLAWNLCDSHLVQEQANQAQMPAVPGLSAGEAMWERLIREDIVKGTHIL